MPHLFRTTTACPRAGFKPFIFLQAACFTVLASSAVAGEAYVSECQFTTAIIDKRPVDKIIEAKRNTQTFFYVEITGDADFWRPEAEGGARKIFHKWSRVPNDMATNDLSSEFVSPGPLGSQPERGVLQSAAQMKGASTYGAFTNLQKSLTASHWRVDPFLGVKDGPPLRATNCDVNLIVK